MSAAKISTKLPPKITKGLEEGIYERIGGAIREVETQQVVAWLREAYELGEPVVSELLSLSSTTANANALNLALSTMQFAVVMRRLETIESQLREAKEVLESIDHKIDLSFYANFRAALDLATNAFMMADRESSRASSMQAINRFLEAEHHYTDLVDTEIAHGSLVADDYLYTLSLAYVTEVRCYLELDEIDTALQRLKEGFSIVKPRFERHIRTLLTTNPAAYLHPSLSGEIDLERLTAIFRWLTPGTHEIDVFEAQRANLFSLAEDPETWVKSLPPAIRLPDKSRAFSAKLLDEVTRQWGKGDLATRFSGLFGALPSLASEGLMAAKLSALRAVSEPDADVFAGLPKTLGQIERMIEQCSRFEMYLAELAAMRESGMKVQEWQALAPKNPPADAQMIFVTPSPTVH